MLMRLHQLSSDIPKPERFTYPFCYEPHPLCILAAEEVKREIERIHPTEGKMFGVLVVSPPESGGVPEGRGGRTPRGSAASPSPPYISSLIARTSPSVRSAIFATMAGSRPSASMLRTSRRVFSSLIALLMLGKCSKWNSKFSGRDFARRSLPSHPL